MKKNHGLVAIVLGHNRRLRNLKDNEYTRQLTCLNCHHAPVAIWRRGELYWDQMVRNRKCPYCDVVGWLR